ncbi:MAG TPA: hypothetical protein VKV26_10035 [Dehalococcoidia bacterium]|nr:hypothetical protein [Dehalococcoidia bacterium]
MRRPRLVPEGPAAGEALAATAALTPARARPALAVGEPHDAWGRLPELSLVAACGLLLVAAGDTAAWRGERFGAALFWAGLVGLLLPFSARLLAYGPSRRERLGLVLVLGLGLYLVKVFHSPLHFTDIDELSHYRTINDILRSNHLFHENPLLTVSPFYPGLEIAVSAVARISGLGLYPSAVVVVSCGKLLLLLSLFLFFERVGGSSRVAGIACLIYTLNPNFVFFDSNFSYESLALPLAALTLYLAALVASGQLRLRAPAILGIFGLAWATAATHHMTSYILLLFLALWTLLAVLGPEPDAGRAEAKRVGLVTLLVLVAIAIWTDLISGLAIAYLKPVLGNAALGLVRLALREQSARQLFHTGSGYVAAAWERDVAVAAVALTLLSLPFGLWQVWRRYRARALVVALALVVCIYPLTLGLRLTSVGAETSNRAAEFLFVAIGFVAAPGPAAHRLRGRLGTLMRVSVLAPCATVMFVGGLIIGSAPWARLPGPYIVGADDRSIDSEGIAAAEWTLGALGPDNRITSDRYGTLLLGSIGEQRSVTGLIDRIPTGLIALFTSPTIGLDELNTIEHGDIWYIEIDRRISMSLPRTTYFDSDPPRSSPVNPAALAKYDNLDGVSRLYDSGNIILYDINGLRYGP